MDMKQWALHDIEICSICFFQVLTFFIFIFENRVILWVSINYPKPILKELFNLQLWPCTFNQHVTVLFHLYTFLNFIELFAYFVPLSASLKFVSATFVLVCFLTLNEVLLKLGKMLFISLQKLFSFSRKSNFRILHFQILWRHQMPKHKTRNTFHWKTWEYSLLMKFGQFMSYYKRKNFIKKFNKNCSLKTSSRPFCVCKEWSITSIGKWNFWSKLLILGM